jgi:hypothetical protein
MIEDDPEPESPESEAVNNFFDAIAAGKGVRAANALRSLESLDGYSLEFLADLLDNLKIYGQIFPYRLKWEKLGGKGRPKKKPDTSNLNCLGLGCATAFFHGIAAGNAPEAAKALRTLKTLHGAQLKLLADLFDAKAVLPEGFYWRLNLAAPHAGTTVDSVSSAARDFWWKPFLNAALAAHPAGAKKEAVKHELMKRTGKSRTTVTDMMKRLGNPPPPKSK